MAAAPWANFLALEMERWLVVGLLQFTNQILYPITRYSLPSVYLSIRTLV
jgi:hypothetical protein